MGKRSAGVVQAVVVVIPGFQDWDVAGKVLKLGCAGEVLIGGFQGRKRWVVRFIGGINVVAAKDEDIRFGLGNDIQNGQRFCRVQAATNGDGLQWVCGRGQKLDILRGIRATETENCSPDQGCGEML